MIIGLTGGIGSGKSVVAKILETMGCVIFNSDNAAREIYHDPEVRTKVTALLGSQSYLTATTINKKHIGAQIFGNSELLLQLNNIIHPAVARSFKTFVAAHPGKTVVKESALLFEANVAGQVNKVIMVAADDAIRIQRVIARDGLTREEVLKKINSQMLQDEKIKRSDFVIYNNEKEFLVPQVIEILKKTNHA
ncbi:MAG: dephospho-CoA kinase [Bacteroidota bacterium]